MKPDEDVLVDITKDGTVDLDLWPELLKRLLKRLETIATDNFPKPTAAELLVDITTAATPILESSTQPDPSSQASTQPISSPPVAQQQQPVPPPTLGPSSSTLTEVATPPRSPGPSHPSGLHSADLSVIASLCETLTANFATAPPHTIQRLAELLLSPREHYTSLSKYLRALQRVLSVSSTTTCFPLEPASSALQNGGNGGATGGGVNGTFGLGSDESLGGALLTPIPWLMREDCGGEAEEHALSPSPGPAAMVGVTQGELLRMEQEAGVVPANQGLTGDEERKEALKIGPEDVGPQPEGTVFPDAPATEEEIVIERRDEEMGDAPATASETVTAITTTAEVREGSGEKEKEKENGNGATEKTEEEETKGEDEKMQD